MITACGEQAEADTAAVRHTACPDAEIEAGDIDLQIADPGVGNFAFDLSALELNDLAARANHDFLQLFEVFDLVCTYRRKLSHRVRLVIGLAELLQSLHGPHLLIVPPKCMVAKSILPGKCGNASPNGGICFKSCTPWPVATFGTN